MLCQPVRVGPGGCDCDYTLQLQFAHNSAELTASDKAQIDRIIPVLKNPKSRSSPVKSMVIRTTPAPMPITRPVETTRRIRRDLRGSHKASRSEIDCHSGLWRSASIASNDTKKGASSEPSRRTAPDGLRPGTP
jgi:hypothetical protein